MVAAYVAPRSRDVHSSAPSWTLTAFERRTLELFASGLPRGEIARVLKPGGACILADVRHEAQYAGVLRASGVTEETVREELERLVDEGTEEGS